MALQRGLKPVGRSSQCHERMARLLKGGFDCDRQRVERAKARLAEALMGTAGRENGRVGVGAGERVERIARAARDAARTRRHNAEAAQRAQRTELNWRTLRYLTVISHRRPLHLPGSPKGLSSRPEGWRTRRMPLRMARRAQAPARRRLRQHRPVDPRMHSNASARWTDECGDDNLHKSWGVVAVDTNTLIALRMQLSWFDVPQS